MVVEIISGEVILLEMSTVGDDVSLSGGGISTGGEGEVGVSLVLGVAKI